MNHVAVITVTIFLLDLAQGQIYPHVEIPSGKIQGSLLSSMAGVEILSFRGVPYAEPPVGELRFQVKIYNNPILIL